MNQFFRRKLFLVMASISLSSCGGNNPQNMLHEPFQFPQLDLLGGATVAGGTISPDSGILFTAIQGSAVTAPADGVVVAKGSGEVIIAHTARLQTQILSLTTIAVREGDTIARLSTSLGTMGTTNISMKVLLDGRAVCPHSFLTNNARGALSSVGCN